MNIATISPRLAPGGFSMESQAGSPAVFHPTFGQAPYNLGDQFIWMAIARVLIITSVRVLPWNATQDQIDKANEECDLFVLVAQNILVRGGPTRCFPMDLFKRIKIPVLVLSLGTDGNLNEPFEPLSETDVESLKVIESLGSGIQVRGYLSEAILNHHKIRSEVAGCPALFWRLQHEIKIDCQRDHVPIGWTMNQFGRKDSRYWDQSAAVASLGEDLVILAQGGEIALQDLITWRDGGWPAQVRQVDGKLEYDQPDDYMAAAKSDFIALPEATIVRLLSKAFLASNWQHYLYQVRTMRYILGVRVHGNMAALSQGVPAFYLYHDWRSYELSQIMGVPAMPLAGSSQNVKNLVPYKTSFRAFELAYMSLWNNLARLLWKVRAPSRVTCYEGMSLSARLPDRPEEVISRFMKNYKQ